MKTYETRDMGFGAYLVCVGYRRLPSVLKNNIVYFVFEDPDSSINKEYDAYKIGDASVVAIRFNEILKTLKKDVIDLKNF